VVESSKCLRNDHAKKPEDTQHGENCPKYAVSISQETRVTGLLQYLQPRCVEKKFSRDSDPRTPPAAADATPTALSILAQAALKEISVKFSNGSVAARSFLPFASDGAGTDAVGAVCAA
jgi:hypothetical protein